MAADLQSVDVLAQMIGVVDGPAGEPQHLALELAQDGELVWCDGLSHDRPRQKLSMMIAPTWRYCLPISALFIRYFSVDCQILTWDSYFMPKRPIDEIDRKILEHLQADGRMSLNDLADKVGLSPSPCLRRVRMLENDGVIAR